MAVQSLRRRREGCGRLKFIKVTSRALPAFAQLLIFYLHSAPIKAVANESADCCRMGYIGIDLLKVPAPSTAVGLRLEATLLGRVHPDITCSVETRKVLPPNFPYVNDRR